MAGPDVRNLRKQSVAYTATVRQFVKFGIVGATNTAWDFGVYYLLTRGVFGFTLHFLTANIIAFSISVVNSYILNRAWTFRSTDGRHHVLFVKFLTVNLVTLGLYEVLLYLLINRAHLFDLLAKLISIGVVMVWNFAANKMWTFRANLPKDA